MKLDFSYLGRQIRENLNQSVTSKTNYYENDNFPSLNIKGTTSILRVKVGYYSTNGGMEMLSKSIVIGADQDYVVDHAKDGLKAIPFSIFTKEEKRVIRIGGGGFESSLDIGYNKVINETESNIKSAFSLTCNDKLEITEEVSDKVLEEVIKPCLSFDVENTRGVVFVAVQFYLAVDEYFHSGKDNYHSVAFVDKEHSKPFLTLNCYSCNHETYGLTTFKNENDINFELKLVCSLWGSKSVFDTDTDHCTMYAGGFNGRVKLK